jgi:bisphosphoglycerate-dependent phosphoglycerate mutase
VSISSDSIYDILERQKPYWEKRVAKDGKVEFLRLMSALLW